MHTMPYTIKDRVHFLSEASKILSSSLDYKVTLSSIAKLVVLNIGDFCIIDLLDDNRKMQRVAAVSYEEDKKKLSKKFFSFPADPKNKMGIYDVSKSGKSILIPKVTNNWMEVSSRLDDERNVVKQLGIKSVIFSPLKSRNKTIGVLTVASSSKFFNKKDTVLVEELAIRAGITIDKTRLFASAKEALRIRDEFLSIASHELRTPLTSILLNIQLILQKIRRSSPRKIKIEDIIRMLEVSEQQSIRLSKLINDLLNISVVSTGRLEIVSERVNLYKLIKDTVNRFEVQLKKLNTKIIIKNKKEIIGYWDRVRIEQVITNLITNAIKYGAKKPILIQFEKVNEIVVIKIIDNGIGIRKKDQLDIFDRFKRSVSSRDYKGLGVGLYISKQIIEAHGGNIKVESSLGKGSTFIITLPLQKA